MAQNLIQNQINKLSVILTTTGGLPATGLIFSDVVCQFSKNGASFSAKTLTSLIFLEVGFGYYTVEFSASDCNTLGHFVAIISGGTIAQSTTSAEVVAAASASTVASIQTCTVTGHLVNGQGVPISDAAVSARILGLPTLVNTGVVGVGIGDDVVSVKTDSNGFFSLELARLVVFDVIIPEINYRRTLTVPNSASVDLFTQVP